MPEVFPSYAASSIIVMVDFIIYVRMLNTNIVVCQYKACKHVLPNVPLTSKHGMLDMYLENYMNITG